MPPTPLRASQRALDPAHIVGEPYHSRRKREPLTPGEVYRLDIPLTGSHLVPAGCRIRLDLCCADSTVTDLQFGHAFTPDMVGTDTYHHSAKHPSHLTLPLLSGKLPACQA
jgi:predicted acyl esterase